MYLRYNELRLLMADQSAFDAQELVSDRRDEQRGRVRDPAAPSWVGTATDEALAFPYNALWGFPEKFHAGEPATTGEVKGLAASPGVVEGLARYVASLDEFDQVRDGEILVCRMTNPAWVVLFTKITGLVTEAGGTVSHPAVVAREFGIPAVVGTTNAGERIKHGRPDPRQRLDGRGRAPLLTRLARTRPRSRRRSRCAPSTATTATVRRRRDVPRHPHEPGLHRARGAALARRRRRPGRGSRWPRRRAAARRDGHPPRGRARGRRRDGLARAAHAFSLVASPRVRNVATVGGVLADADYASDPPAVLAALGARARAALGRAASARSAIEELIRGLLRDLHRAGRAARRGARAAAARAARSTASSGSRSSEDRPCVAVAAVRAGTACASSSARWPRRRSTSPTSARSARDAPRRSAPPTPSGSSRSPTRAARPRTGGG